MHGVKQIIEWNAAAHQQKHQIISLRAKRRINLIERVNWINLLMKWVIQSFNASGARQWVIACAISHHSLHYNSIMFIAPLQLIWWREWNEIHLKLMRVGYSLRYVFFRFTLLIYCWVMMSSYSYNNFLYSWFSSIIDYVIN